MYVYVLFFIVKLFVDWVSIKLYHIKQCNKTFETIKGNPVVSWSSSIWLIPCVCCVHIHLKILKILKLSKFPHFLLLCWSYLLSRTYYCLLRFLTIVTNMVVSKVVLIWMKWQSFWCYNFYNKISSNNIQFTFFCLSLFHCLYVSKSESLLFDILLKP